MKRQSIIIILSTFMAAVLATPAWTQMATVRGVALDQQGNPIVGATVEMHNKDNGQKYSLKTDKKGQIFSIGITSGKYDIDLMKDGKKLYYYTNFTVTLAVEENILDFKLNELQGPGTAATQSSSATQVPVAPAPAKQPKLTEEQKKQLEKQLEEKRQQDEAAQKENAKIGSLNKYLADAKIAADAGNLDAAIASMKQATATDPSRDVLWGKLGSYQNDAAKKVADAAAKVQLYKDAGESLKKATAICDQTPATATCKTQNGSYHNNAAQALVASGHMQEGMAEYEKAAQLDPALAGMVYFNEGAVLTNEAGRQAAPAQRTQYIDQANAAFDKAIAANPNSVGAWCEKGKNLIQKATYDAGGKITPAPGTVDALNKCLELDQNGQYTADAKALLEAMGQTVQTTYGNKKPAPKK